MLWEEEERMRNASVRIRACGIRKQTPSAQRLFPKVKSEGAHGCIVGTTLT